MNEARRSVGLVQSRRQSGTSRMSCTLSTMSLRRVGDVPVLLLCLLRLVSVRVDQCTVVCAVRYVRTVVRYGVCTYSQSVCTLRMYVVYLPTVRKNSYS